MQLARGGGGGYCVEKATGFRCGANNTPMEFKGTRGSRRVYECRIILDSTICSSTLLIPSFHSHRISFTRLQRQHVSHFERTGEGNLGFLRGTQTFARRISYSRFSSSDSIVDSSHSRLNAARATSAATAAQRAHYSCPRLTYYL